MAKRGTLILDCGRIPWRRDILPGIALAAVTYGAMGVAGVLLVPEYASAIIAILVGTMLVMGGLMFFWFGRRRVRVWQSGLESQAGFQRWSRIKFVELYGEEHMSVVTQRAVGRWGLFDEVLESRIPRETFSELGAKLEELIPGRVRVRL